MLTLPKKWESSASLSRSWAQVLLEVQNYLPFVKFEHDDEICEAAICERRRGATWGAKRNIAMVPLTKSLAISLLPIRPLIENFRPCTNFTPRRMLSEEARNSSKYPEFWIRNSQLSYHWRKQTSASAFLRHPGVNRCPSDRDFREDQMTFRGISGQKPIGRPYCPNLINVRKTGEIQNLTFRGNQGTEMHEWNPKFPDTIILNWKFGRVD